MRPSEEWLLENIRHLDPLQMRTLNRFYLHPRGIRCCTSCLTIYTGIAEHFSIKKYYADGAKGYDVLCKTCKNAYNQKLTAQYRQAPHDFIRSRIAGYRNRAKNAGVAFNITAEYLIQQWDTQAGLCFYTLKPIDFTLVSPQGTHPHNQTPSVDRLDPTQGYTVGNVVWCAYVINRMKNDLNYEEFVQTCSHIVKVRTEWDS